MSISWKTSNSLLERLLDLRYVTTEWELYNTWVSNNYISFEFDGQVTRHTISTPCVHRYNVFLAQIELHLYCLYHEERVCVTGLDCSIAWIYSSSMRIKIAVRTADIKPYKCKMPTHNNWDAHATCNSQVTDQWSGCYD